MCTMAQMSLDQVPLSYTPLACHLLMEGISIFIKTIYSYLIYDYQEGKNWCVVMMAKFLISQGLEHALCCIVCWLHFECNLFVTSLAFYFVLYSLYRPLQGRISKPEEKCSHVKQQQNANPSTVFPIGSLGNLILWVPR